MLRIYFIDKELRRKPIQGNCHLQWIELKEEKLTELVSIKKDNLTNNVNENMKCLKTVPHHLEQIHQKPKHRD